MSKIQDAGSTLLDQLQNEAKNNNTLLYDIVSYETDIPKDALKKLFLTTDDQILEYVSTQMEELNIAKTIKYYKDFKKIITQ